MSISKEERETVIRINGVEKEWTVWTDDKKFINKFKRAGYVGERTLPGDGVEFVVPFKSISIRRARSVKNPKRRNKDATFGRPKVEAV